MDNKKRGYTQKALESAFWVMAGIIVVGFMTLIVFIIA